MRRCNKCDIQKEDNQFYTYYHSTQKKYRTRNICNECINKQKAEYKQKMKGKIIIPEIVQPIFVELPIEPPVDHQFCPECDNWLPKTDFYPYLKARCKKCQLAKDAIERAEKRIEAGGSAKVMVYPNKYADDMQKQQTFEVMEVLGYTFNEENGVWYKLPWKDKDGKFPLLDTYGKSKKPRKSRVGRTREIPQEEKDEVIRLYSEGYKYKEIEKITGTPNGTIWKWVNKHKLNLGR